MNQKPKIYGDFNDGEELGRIRLLEPSLEYIDRLGLTLKDGMEIEVDDGEELSADGIVHFSDLENIWVAEIDWKKLRYKDEE